MGKNFRLDFKMIAKIFSLSFKKQLLNIFNNDEIKVKNSIENFLHSYSKLNLFIKFIILNYLILTFITNLLFTVVFIYKLKLDYFYEVGLFLKKIPLIKNVQNFLIANLLLHID
tara:strand:- start:472 stop:813 length:342 start_codon:yes stop_codon:yes gene_type:complete